MHHIASRGRHLKVDIIITGHQVSHASINIDIFPNSQLFFQRKPCFALVDYDSLYYYFYIIMLLLLLLLVSLLILLVKGILVSKGNTSCSRLVSKGNSICSSTNVIGNSNVNGY